MSLFPTMPLIAHSVRCTSSTPRMRWLYAEIELGKIAVQMLLAAMLVHTFHPALEDRIEAFDGIGVDDATHILADAVIDGLMHPGSLPSAP